MEKIREHLSQSNNQLQEKWAKPNKAYCKIFAKFKKQKPKKKIYNSQSNRNKPFQQRNIMEKNF